MEVSINGLGNFFKGENIFYIGVLGEVVRGCRRLYYIFLVDIFE